MKYRNTNPNYALSFSFGKGLDFEVPVGGTVEIDDKWHPWVISRGLHLEVVVPEPAPEPKVTKRNAATYRTSEG